MRTTVFIPPAGIRIVRGLLLGIAALQIGSTDAAAQAAGPIGPFAVDLRAALPRFKDTASVAVDLGVSSGDLPTRGFGIAGGAHWYPTRLGKVTIGVGGGILISGAGKTAGGAGAAEGPVVRTRFTSVSPEFSLNFGRARGWSYLSGGIGWAGFHSEREDAPVGPAPSRPRALTYGGGARWFAKDHLAFAIDLRFYRVSSQLPTAHRPAYPSMTLMVFSAGVSVK